MPIASSILPEFDHEMATTRRLLERVPEDDAAWQPHAKSMTLGELATHIGGIPQYGAITIRLDELDVAPIGGEARPRPTFSTTAALIDTFDANVRETREALETVTDEQLMQPWSLKSAGHTVFTLPRTAAIRSMMLSHLIHHRGQLSVYLRLRDVPLPSIYGPTADEH